MPVAPVMAVPVFVNLAVEEPVEIVVTGRQRSDPFRPTNAASFETTERVDELVVAPVAHSMNAAPRVLSGPASEISCATCANRSSSPISAATEDRQGGGDRGSVRDQVDDWHIGRGRRRAALSVQPALSGERLFRHAWRPGGQAGAVSVPAPDLPDDDPRHCGRCSGWHRTAAADRGLFLHRGCIVGSDVSRVVNQRVEPDGDIREAHDGDDPYLVRREQYPRKREERIERSKGQEAPKQADAVRARTHRRTRRVRPARHATSRPATSADIAPIRARRTG